MAFCELRQYEIRPGCMADWLKLMEEEIIPRQVALGMIIAGSFRGGEDDSVYVWLRRFESEEQRERQTRRSMDRTSGKPPCNPKWAN
ncbi:NIPSNAP family protein [Arenibacterium sp. CAU 1754]